MIITTKATVAYNKKLANWWGQAKRRVIKKFDKRPSEAASSAVLAKFDKSRPEAASDVKSGRLVRLSVSDKCEKFRYPCLNLSEEILP